MIGLTYNTEPVTTSGVIALVNLHGQINNLESQVAAGRLGVTQWANLIDLLNLRGQILGLIVDYERAATLAEQLVYAAPADGLAFLARARTRAAFHLFVEALADLDIAERLGSERFVLEAERAAIFQALGRYDEALALRENAVKRRPDFATLGALAVLKAEQGEITEAEYLFNEGRQRYQEVSPFPVAQLDFRCGLMWLEQGDLHTARAWFEATLSRLPAYVPAQGHLAEVEAALGKYEAAISRLRPLAVFSNDPEYAGLLADLLSKTGQADEAGQWRSKAAARYDQLMKDYPAAFSDHAAEFWLTTGADAQKALYLARQNLEIRQTPRTYALVHRAVLASANN